MHQRPVI